MFITVLLFIAVVKSSPVTESYKNQYCTDPRTMTKHAAYTEWADAYSCTRHRCQPGGRNLAIYSVGCKRVEAPESAIECEEVVEDTNMQFPYCCTRLRCLVVVRGEVWTRVLGQPWETLPAAPWSHMYKMKRPPPGDEHIGSKSIGPGPVYELENPNEPHEKILRSSKSTTAPDCNDGVPRAAPAPDIVIALATSNDEKEKNPENIKHKRVSKPNFNANKDDDTDRDRDRDHNEVDFEDAAGNEQMPESSDEKISPNHFGVTQKGQTNNTWTDIPLNQWNEHDPSVDVENTPPVKEKTDKPTGLQALVDAIGNRMRDIESVVQRMSEKVHKESDIEDKLSDNEVTSKHHKSDKKREKDEVRSPKKLVTKSDVYKRFPSKSKGSKYLRSDTNKQSYEVDNVNGYFSDASNTFRRNNGPKEPAPTYVAPVDTRRKEKTDVSEENEKKHKKHNHKRKRKNKSHKKHHKDDKRKHLNKLSSIEMDKNVVSLEDSDGANK